MVATVNPCGFAMLPAYLSFFLGVEQDRASTSRALVVGTAVTVGFVGTFAVVGLVVSRVTRSVYDVAPWISLVIGACADRSSASLLLRGFDLAVRLPRLDRGGRTGGVGSMALFGVSYAVASIGCELPLFLAAMSGAFGKNLASGVVYFVFFGLGFGADHRVAHDHAGDGSSVDRAQWMRRVALREPHRRRPARARRRVRRVVRLARDPHLGR